ncbi:MAG: aminoacyl-tRNA hydrolase [Hyphomonadaceae bacterium]
MLLIAGLGNPGPGYAGHRHNIGFQAIDRMAERFGFGPWRRKFQGELAEGRIPLPDGGQEKTLLLKPQTFMNNSGHSIGEAMRFHKLAPEHVVVFYDELDLAPGRLRMKVGGGAAGHNGIRSIIAQADPGVRRARMGIGHPGHKDRVHGYVLSDFAKADQDWLGRLLDACAEALPFLAAGDDDRYQAEVMRLAPAPKGDPRKGGQTEEGTD